MGSSVPPEAGDNGFDSVESARSGSAESASSKAGDIRFRVGHAADGHLVGRCVYLALAWDPARPIPDMATVLAHPDVTRYHRDWGRPGDVVVIAESTGDAVGYAFARLFTEADRGHGFVDEATPELGVAVEPEHRGKGTGTRLLEHLHGELRRRGFTSVSLSVELDNRAKRLYERLGYVETGQRDGASIMLMTL